MDIVKRLKKLADRKSGVSFFQIDDPVKSDFYALVAKHYPLSTIPEIKSNKSFYLVVETDK